ncbi:unnamed protein product [Cunninghamella blakesleeana]
MQKQKVEIYTATYSGIQVFEMTINDLNVMRRRSDSYLNATQILKLSGFDKGKRTKILEREILDSNYEKIQGGYGKYQGTWVPLERGRELADRYEVLDLLLPLIEFDASKWDELPEKEQLPTKSTRLRNNYSLTAIQHSTPPTSPSNTSSPSDASTNVAFIKRKLTSIENEDNNTNSNNSLLTPVSSQTQPSANVKKKIKAQSQGKQKQLNDNTNNTINNNDNSNMNNNNNNSNNDNNANNTNNNTNNNDNNDNGISSQSSTTSVTNNKDVIITIEDMERYKKTMLSIFISDDDHIPPLLRGAGATNGLDMDVNIDEEGHSTLHWAVSMARIHITEWLVSKGASTCKLNHKGETPLIRGVMTPNCYENECFPHMLDILKESILLVDNHGRSVLHHIVLSTVNTTYTGHSLSTSSTSSSQLDSQPLTPITTSSELRLQASICYMQTVLKVIHQLQLEYFINKVDNNGESPFAIATRLQCDELCQLLTQSDNIMNKNNDQDHNSQLEIDSTINRKRSFNADSSLIDKKISDQLKKQKKRGEKKMDKKANKESQNLDLLNGSSSTKGQELAITVQRFVDAMDLEFNNKLQSREVELTRMQSEYQELTQKFEKERSEWNTSIKNSNQQLNDANIRIKQLEEMLDKSSLNNSENGINSSSTATTNTKLIEKKGKDNNSNSHEREKQLEEKIRQLQSDLRMANIKTRKLDDMEQMYMKAVEKELGCKRLIAACCNLPMDNIDEFIEPLTLAIENDPPDMDFSRVIGFMEKLRRHQQ